MDRIDSMTHEELKAAARTLIDAAKRLSAISAHCGSLVGPLAAFDPTPLDCARKALEDAGFVPLANLHEGRSICLHEYGKSNIAHWYSLPKEPA